MRLTEWRHTVTVHYDHADYPDVTYAKVPIEQVPLSASFSFAYSGLEFYRLRNGKLVCTRRRRVQLTERTRGENGF